MTADEISLTVSERGSAVGTRATAAIVGGADDASGTVLTYPMYVGAPQGAPPLTIADGTIDMLAFWGGTAILSVANVSDLFVNEWKYSELPGAPLIASQYVVDTFTDTDTTAIALHTPDTDTEAEINELKDDIRTRRDQGQ